MADLPKLPDQLPIYEAGLEERIRGRQRGAIALASDPVDEGQLFEWIKHLMLERCCAAARRDGHLAPVLFAGLVEYTLVGVRLLDDFFSSAAGREEFALAARGLAASPPTSVIGIGAEVWLAPKEPGMKDPRDRVDRSEMLMIRIESRSGRSETWLVELGRIGDEIYVEQPELCDGPLIGGFGPFFSGEGTDDR